MHRTIITFLLLIISEVFSFQIQRFPPNFKFGLATASYQIEGGWNASGKGESIWDRFTHAQPNRIEDHTTGDIACDSYHLWKNDVALLKEIGVHFYRFSLSWSRILPTGFSNDINPDGVRYYNDLIDELLKNGIEPIVTLFHWDLPQTLQEIGGMTSTLIVEYFGDYASTVFSLFGDRVKKWITFNEPSSVCLDGFENGESAPGFKIPGIGCYLCSKTLLLAHARAYRIYDKHFRKIQRGKVGITIDAEWYEPKTSSPEDVEAAERAIQMNFGWWVNPIFSPQGDFPEIMKNRIENVSRAQNFSESRLPVLTQYEIQNIRGTYDFLGLNHYTSRIVSEPKSSPSMTPSFFDDVGVNAEIDPKWKRSAADWLVVVPWGFRRLLNWIKDKYDNPLIYITENGFADKGQLNDVERIEYHQQYLTELLYAIKDGCNVQRYTLWSLMDNMEWSSGYTLKFGLYYVDFNSDNRTRISKKSASYFKSIIRNNGLTRFTKETSIYKYNV